MSNSLNESLYQAVVAQDCDEVIRLLIKGANPNQTVKTGKTCLGEAACIGNLDVMKILIEAANQKKTSTKPFKKRQYKPTKRKLRQDAFNIETVANRFSDSPLAKFESDQEENNRGYFVYVHGDSSSSDESRLPALRSPISPSTPTPLPHGDLEWDEDIVNVAPTTKEDETWSSMYKWYAAILESTGSALSAASKVSNGIDQQDIFGRAALHYSSENGHVAATNLLVQAGCKIDITAADSLTPLHLAVISNKPAMVEALLAAGANVNYKTHEKMTALHFATTRGLEEIVILLVRSGAYVEARDTSERTPLYLAAGRGHYRLVKYLISVGANVNCEEIHGYTPLCEAVWQRYPAVVKVLLMAKIRISYSHRLLHNAIIQRQYDTLKMLADLGGGVNLYNDQGDTPLLLATRLTQPTAARLLLERGAHVNMCNNITGANAVHIAVEHAEGGAKFEGMLLALLEHGVDLDAAALTGDTPLNRALLLQKDEAAEHLIRHGANVNMSDLHSCGLDNLSMASRLCSPHLARLLVLAGHRPPGPTLAAPAAVPCWVERGVRRPLLLAQYCRIAIRRLAHGRVLLAFVLLLPLPPTLKRYLMMEGE